MRTLTVAVCLMAVAVAGLGAPGPDKLPNQPSWSVPPVGREESGQYAMLMQEAIQKVRDEYIRPVDEQKLAGAAIQALFEAANAPIPNRWRGDPATFLAGRDLLAEFHEARRTAGNPAALAGENAVRISLQAMVRQLDPYCAYVSADELSRNRFEGVQIGVGIQIEERSAAGPLYVRTVAIGSPAQKAGVLPGDQIVQIDDEPTDRLSARQGDKRCDGPPGSHVVLRLRTQGSRDARDVQLMRSSFREESVMGVRRFGEESWDFVLDGDRRIGFIRLGRLTKSPSFDRDATSSSALEVEEALLQMRRSGLSGLVLDLRDCPLGLIDQAVSIAGLFLPPDAPVAIVKYRSRPDEQHESSGSAFTKLPLVVLIGPDTSGAGELIACALQDNGRAPLIGQRTRGKDTVQPADNDAGRLLLGASTHGLRLSTGQFIRPSGKNLGRLPDSKPWDEWGVQPTPGFEVPLTADVRRQIRQWRLRQDLRPAESRAALPLDDWSNDPVLYTGLKRLRELIRERAKEAKNEPAGQVGVGPNREK
jgi:carboxyl-terminal processing protease